MTNVDFNQEIIPLILKHSLDAKKL